ncbi:MAG: hypothetical protein ACR2NW_04165 [Thermodesulfobacteriota bacterium]
MVVQVILIIWLILAIVIAKLGVLKEIPPVSIQIILFALTLLCILSYLLSIKFREFINRIGVKGILIFHLVRFVGFYFLYLYSLNRLPYDFAVKGGWGDIAVAVFASVILMVPVLLQRKGILLAWNIFGLIDIIFVVATAGRINMSNPGELFELTVLPLSLLPTFVVPLIISTHVFMFHLLKKK